MNYLDKLAENIQSLSAERSALERAAALLADAQQHDHLIHVFGTEPATAALIPEVFFRAGALTNVNPMLDPSLDPAHGAYRNAMCMELDGLAPCILDYYEYVEAGEPIVLLGSNPHAPMFAQALTWAKSKGLKTIAVICRGCDCEADVVLHHGALEDSLMEVNGIALGGEQTALLCTMLQLLTAETVKRLEKAEKHVWKGVRTVDLNANAATIDERLFRIRHL